MGFPRGGRVLKNSADSCRCEDRRRDRHRHCMIDAQHDVDVVVVVVVVGTVHEQRIDGRMERIGPCARPMLGVNFVSISPRRPLRLAKEEEYHQLPTLEGKVAAGVDLYPSPEVVLTCRKMR